MTKVKCTAIKKYGDKWVASFDNTPKTRDNYTWFDLVINPKSEDFKIGKTYSLQLLKEPPRPMPKRDGKGKFVKSGVDKTPPVTEFVPRTTYEGCSCFFCSAARVANV